MTSQHSSPTPTFSPSGRDMTFTDDDLRALACFLARRVTPDLRVVPPAIGSLQPVEPEAVVAWEHALADARARGGVAALVHQAAAVRPDDVALREAAALVWPDRRGSGSRTLAVMVAVGAMVALIVGVASMSTAGALLVVGAAVGPPPVVTVTEAPSPAQQALAEVGDHPAASVRVVTAPDPAPSDVADGDGADVPAIAPMETVAEVAPVAPPPREEEAPALRGEDGPLGEPLGAVHATVAGDTPAASGRPSRAPCQVEGWFYAGRERPADAFVAPHPMYVRARPPRKENGWRLDKRIRCYLAKGDVVRITEPPMESNGHYWVKISPGSVTRPVEVAVLDEDEDEDADASDGEGSAGLR